jgi:hypothetical protein
MIAIAREGEESVRQIELFGRRFAPRHVEFQAPRAERFVIVADLVAQSAKVFLIQIGDASQLKTSFIQAARAWRGDDG